MEHEHEFKLVKAERYSKVDTFDEFIVKTSACQCGEILTEEVKIGAGLE